MPLQALSKLKIPVQIDLSKIQNDWKLQVISQAPYFNNGDTLRTTPAGIKTTVVIIEDNFDYDDKGKGINIFEKLVIKTPVENNPKTFTSRQEVKIAKLTKATIYGDYANQISLEGVLLDINEYNALLKQQQQNLKSKTQ